MRVTTLQTNKLQSWPTLIKWKTIRTTFMAHLLIKSLASRNPGFQKVLSNLRLPLTFPASKSKACVNPLWKSANLMKSLNNPSAATRKVTRTMSSQAAMSSSQATRRKVEHLKINMRMILLMMGGKNKKRPANASKTKRATWAQRKIRALALTLPKPKTWKKKMKMILMINCLRKRRTESGDSIKRPMNTTLRIGSGCQLSNSTVSFPTKEWESAGSMTFTKTKWVEYSETIWAWVKQCKWQLCWRVSLTVSRSGRFSL